jgi:rhodanese-related sulfurtransferase
MKPKLTMTPSTFAPSRRQVLRSAAVLATASSLWACSQEAPMDPSWRVDLDEGRSLLESGQAVVFDIREPDEHATGVAAGTRLLPMSSLNQRVQEIPKDPQQAVLLICNTQNRSGAVIQALREAGWTNVRYVNGGMSEWARRGWPMVAPTAQQP